MGGRIRLATMSPVSTSPAQRVRPWRASETSASGAPPPQESAARAGEKRKFRSVAANFRPSLLPYHAPFAQVG